MSPFVFAFLIRRVRRWYAPAHVQNSPMYCECKLIAFPRILFSLSFPRAILAAYTAGEKTPNFAWDPIWRDVRLFDRATGRCASRGLWDTTKFEPRKMAGRCECDVAIQTEGRGQRHEYDSWEAHDEHVGSPPETPPREEGANPSTEVATRATARSNSDTRRFMVEGGMDREESKRGSAAGCFMRGRGGEEKTTWEDDEDGDVATNVAFSDL